MAPLPSVLRGNVTATAEQIRLYPPSFSKPSTNAVQQKPLQIEKRFSHYEQKMNSTAVDKCNTKIPRRLQTRSILRQIEEPKQTFGEEKIKWNARLAAWIYDDKNRPLKYIKISDQCDLVKKEFYYCCACHEYFHATLRSRDKAVLCPRYHERHANYIRPVSLKKIKKNQIKTNPQPVANVNPFPERKNVFSIPSLLPPKPLQKPKRKVKIEIPMLPKIPQTRETQRSRIFTSSRGKREKDYSPEESEDSYEKNRRTPLFSTELSDFRRLPSLSDYTPEITQEGNDGEEECLVNQSAETNSVELEKVSVKAVDAVKTVDAADAVEAVKERIRSGSSNRSAIQMDKKLVKFDDVASNECVSESDRDGYSSLEFCNDQVSSDQGIETDIDITLSDFDSESVELFLSPDELRLPSISPLMTPPDSDTEFPRPKPPPPLPSLPTLRLTPSPDTSETRTRPVQLKRRNAVIIAPLPTIEQVTLDEEKQVTDGKKRLTQYELDKRMNQAKERERYHKDTKKYTAQPVSSEEEFEIDAEEINLNDDSFLEKYCLVSSKHLMKCRRIFKKLDADDDGHLTCEEVINAIYKMFSPNVIDDLDLCYIFRILEVMNFDKFEEKMDLKLFAIIIALAEKIGRLDHYMKNLIGRVNIEVVDWKLVEYRKMFEETVKINGKGEYRMPIESLWLELKAGGISEEHERQARIALGHLKEMDILDFVTFLPLFLFIHSNIVNSPLNIERHA